MPSGVVAPDSTGVALKDIAGRDDDALHIDIIPVERHGEARHPMRGQDETGGPGDRIFRLQGRIACRLGKGHRNGPAVNVVDLPAGSGDDIEQFRQIGGANVEGPGGACTDIVVDLAGEAQLPGFDQPAGRVAGHAAGHVGVQVLDETVLDDRDIEFAVAFNGVVLASHRHEIAAAQRAQGAQGIGGAHHGFLAIIEAEGHRRRAGAGEVPGQHPLHGGSGGILLHIQEIIVVMVHDIIDRLLA